MNGIISTNGLTMQFGAQRALDSVTADVHSGVTGLVGANGAGKTTFLSLVLGLRVPTSGQLTVLGMNPRTNGAALRAQLGYGAERNIVPHDMPASDFVKHMAEMRGMPRSEAKGRASDALWLVGLGEERTRALGTMSTGQRQRVKLAQAIASDPALLLLDEPTDGLDPVQRDDVLTLIKHISREYGIDVLLSSHLLEEVERICDQLVALDAGQLVAQGRITDLVGDQQGVVVELAETSDFPHAFADMVSQLREAGLEVNTNDSAWRMDVIGPEADTLADCVRDAAVDANARLVRVERRKRRLEDLFSVNPL